MLNDQHFVLLAGCPEKWDKEMFELPNTGQTLIELQLSQAGRGRLSARMFLSVHGWTIRYSSNLHNRSIIFGSGSFNPKTAYDWGVKWANINPLKRELYVSKYDIKKCEEKGYDCSILNNKIMVKD